jgi:uncharacterized protein DUF3175
MKRRRSRGFFARSPRAIARGLKRRKGATFQSAMSILNRHSHRGGLSAKRRDRLEEAKIELRALFARTPEGQPPKRARKRSSTSRKG